MTNLEKMKKSMISQIESMDLLQFYNVLLSFEELNFDQQFKDNYGIDMDAFYGCDQCRSDHHGCSVPAGTDAGDDIAICFEKFKEYANKSEWKLL